MEILVTELLNLGCQQRILICVPDMINCDKSASLSKTRYAQVTETLDPCALAGDSFASELDVISLLVSCSTG